MTPATTVVILLAFAAGIGLSYVVIRNAVCAGILDAERKRDLAAAERQMVTRQATGASPQPRKSGGWMDRIVG